jgi:hypothetical protein
MATLVTAEIQGQTAQGYDAMKAASDRFFAAFVVPGLPPGVHPKRSDQALHSLLCKPYAAQAACEART